MTNPNPYQLLGVSLDADSETIQKAFRMLALKTHPDLNRNDPFANEKMKALNWAYTILSDAQRRKEYDATVGIAERERVRRKTEAEGRAQAEQEAEYAREAKEKSSAERAEKERRNRAAWKEWDDTRASANKAREAVKASLLNNVRCDAWWCNNIPDYYCRKCGLWFCGLHQIQTRPDSDCLHLYSTLDRFDCEACLGSGTKTDINQDPLEEIIRIVICPTCSGSGYDTGKIAEIEHDREEKRKQNSLKQQIKSHYKQFIEKQESAGPIGTSVDYAFYVLGGALALLMFVGLLYIACIGPLAGLPPF